MKRTIAILLLLAAACSNLERDNPNDPRFSGCVMCPPCEPDTTAADSTG